MKITSMTADEMELKEGGASGMIVGGAFILVGPLVAYTLREATPYAPLIGIAAAVIGILLILFASSITVNASRTQGVIRFQKKRIVGTKNSQHAIADVFRIETRKTWRMESSSSSDGRPSQEQPVLVAQSVIVFKDGSELALDHQKSSSSVGVGGVAIMSGQGAETAMAAQVAKFLNVPFLEVMPPNMSGGINIIGS